MITLKELEYVRMFPNKTPYSGRDYCEEVFDKLEEAFNAYERVHKNTSYNISLSNQEEIEFMIKDYNIAHMLGLDYKVINSDYNKVYRERILNIENGATISAYESLIKVLEYKKAILDNDERDPSKRIINYHKAAIKLDVFAKISDISLMNFGCINFNSTEFNYNMNRDDRENQVAKFLYFPTEEIVSPYFLMGLTADTRNIDNKYDDDAFGDTSKETQSYCVNTIVTPTNYEYFFLNQETSIPVQLLISNNGVLQKKVNSADNKLNLIKDYNSLITKYDFASMINISGDYQSILLEQSKQEKRLGKSL